MHVKMQLLMVETGGCIHFIRDPKGITYVRFILKIESDAKMRLADLLLMLSQCKIEFYSLVLSIQKQTKMSVYISQQVQEK